MKIKSNLDNTLIICKLLTKFIRNLKGKYQKYKAFNNISALLKYVENVLFFLI